MQPSIDWDAVEAAIRNAETEPGCSKHREERIAKLFEAAEAGDLDAEANLANLVLLQQLLPHELQRYTVLRRVAIKTGA